MAKQLSLVIRLPTNLELQLPVVKHTYADWYACRTDNHINNHYHCLDSKALPINNLRTARHLIGDVSHTYAALWHPLMDFCTQAFQTSNRLSHTQHFMHSRHLPPTIQVGECKPPPMPSQEQRLSNVQPKHTHNTTYHKPRQP